MNDLEERLRRLRPAKAPERIWERARRGESPARMRITKEGLMVAAAAALLIGLLYWHSSPPSPVLVASLPQEEPGWVDREPQPDDLLEQDRKSIETWIEDLGSKELGRWEKASRALKEHLGSAITYLRRAMESDNPEVRDRARVLVKAWERRGKLSEALGRARKESKPREEWKDLARRAVGGDEKAMAEARKIGWEIAPQIADAAANETSGRQLLVRVFLRELLGPILEPRIAVKLTRREGNKEYGTSAYSFRRESQSLEDHGNAVDLVLNRCGLLHISPPSALYNRIVDLGEKIFEGVMDPPGPEADDWRHESVVPKKSHVYVQFVGTTDSSRGFYVKFVVTSVADDSVELEWAVMGYRSTVEGPSHIIYAIMGQCAGRHLDR